MFKLSPYEIGTIDVVCLSPPPSLAQHWHDQITVVSFPNEVLEPCVFLTLANPAPIVPKNPICRQYHLVDSLFDCCLLFRMFFLHWHWQSVVLFRGWGLCQRKLSEGMDLLWSGLEHRGVFVQLWRWDLGSWKFGRSIWQWSYLLHFFGFFCHSPDVETKRVAQARLFTSPTILLLNSFNIFFLLLGPHFLKRVHFLFTRVPLQLLFGVKAVKIYRHLLRLTEFLCDFLVLFVSHLGEGESPDSHLNVMVLSFWFFLGTEFFIVEVKLDCVGRWGVLLHGNAFSPDELFLDFGDERGGV